MVLNNMEATIKQTNNSIILVVISLIITLFAIFATYNTSKSVSTECSITNTATMQWSSDTSSWITSWK